MSLGANDHGLDDYADEVTLQVRFAGGLGAPEEDESWDLSFHPESAWDERAFIEELRGVAAGIGGGCCGTRFHLDTRRSETAWGPSAATTAFLLTLASEALAGGAKATLSPVGKRIAAQMRAGRDPIEGTFTLEESDAVSQAMGAVKRRLNDEQAELSVVEVGSLEEEGGYEVQLEASKPRLRFTVHVEALENVVALCRIVRTSSLK